MYYVYDICGNKVTIEGNGKAITGIHFGVHGGGDIEGRDYLMDQAARELLEYFQGKRKVFDVPLDPRGTVWEKKVWTELLKIPYGETRSYGEIARLLGNGKAYRAVGRASGRNPIMVMVPCHRVIGTDGSMKGYLGGTSMKKYLLELEENFRKN